MATENETQNNQATEASATQAPAEAAAAAPSTEEVTAEAARAAELKDISDLLGLSDAQPKADEIAAAEAAKAAKPEGEADGGKGEQSTAPKPKPVEEVKPKEEAKEPSLKDVLKEVLAEAKVASKSEEAKAPKSEEEQPKYTPAIPDELFQAIEHDDPATRRQALSIMIGGAMNRVYSDVRKEMQAAFADMRNQMPNVVQSVQQNATSLKKMHDDFYEENPNFGATPERKQLVAMVGIQLAQGLGKEYKGFTPEFQKKLAETLQSMTGLPAGKVAAAKKEEPKPVPPKKFQSGGPPARVNGGAPSLGDEIADVISSALN